MFRCICKKVSDMTLFDLITTVITLVGFTCIDLCPRNRFVIFNYLKLMLYVSNSRTFIKYNVYRETTKLLEK